MRGKRIDAEAKHRLKKGGLLAPKAARETDTSRQEYVPTIPGFDCWPSPTQDAPGPDPEVSKFGAQLRAFCLKKANSASERLSNQSARNVIEIAIGATINGLRAMRAEGIRRGYRGVHLAFWQILVEEHLLAEVSTQKPKRGRPRKDDKAELAIRVRSEGVSWAQVTKILNRYYLADERLTREGVRSLVRARASKKRGEKIL